MSLKQKFSRISAKSRSWWVFSFIVVLTLTAVVVVSGESYNRFSDFLSSKTNEIVVLPKTKVLPFSLGLDLQGGAHLVYVADMEGISEIDRGDALESARDIIERRVNLFGVSEPLVQANKTSNGEYRIIVELAGIKDIQEAKDIIGEMPILEFKEQDREALSQIESLISQKNEAEVISYEVEGVDENGEIVINDLDLSSNVDQEESPMEISLSDEDLISLGADSADFGWKSTGLTGKNLKRSSVQFDSTDGAPQISLEFNSEGAEMFAEITARNTGLPVAIFLDGEIESMPVVNERIADGKAVINGNFTFEEAKTLVTRLNSGSLPVPISLILEKTVEASLGSKSITNSVRAGLIGVILVCLFLIIVYRLPGLMAVLSLAVYGALVLSIFKALPLWLAFFLIVSVIALIFYTFNNLKIFDASLAILFGVFGILLFFYALKPVTLTVAGIAGFILSLGMAVDANILIFARVREEIREGKTVSQSVEEGFKKAWPSIRDGNFSTILTCFILMFFGTSTIQGFGTTLFIGIVVSLFSSIVVTRLLLSLVSGPWLDSKTYLFGVNKKEEENKI